MNQPLVSIILTAYNAEKYIEGAVKSVLEQTFTDYELLIYNDGSDDRTKEIAEQFSDSRILLFSSEVNRHIAYGTNFLLKKCRGRYIAIIDADDQWKPDKLEKQIRFLEAHPEYQCCFTWCDIIDEEGTIVNDRQKEFYEMFQAETNTREYWLRYFFFTGNRLCNPSALFTAESAKAVGLHNLFYMQATDMEWWVRFVKKFAFAVIPEPLVSYRANFKDEQKTSRRGEESVTRYVNELFCIRTHFFEDLDRDLFLSAFRDFFVNPEAQSDEELRCEQLFLSLTPYVHAKSVPASGILLLEEALADEALADVLAEKYGFTARKLGEYTAKHVLNDLIIENYTNENDYLEQIRSHDQTRMTYYKEAAKIAESKCAQAEQKLNLAEQKIAALEGQLDLKAHSLG